MPIKNLKTTFAAEEKDIENITALQISSSANSSREKNKSLLKKDSSEFYDGYIYSSKDVTNQIQTITLVTSETELSENQSLYVWVFIPSVMVGDLNISVSDGTGNMLSWGMSGLELTEESNYNLSLIDIIISYNGRLTRGWKLLELTQNDAQKNGELNAIKQFSVSYKNYGSSEENQDSFAVSYPFVADKFGEKAAVVHHQEYVVYAQKQTFLEQTENIYVGDNVIIKTAKEIFSYAIVGRQNVLVDSSGFVWNAFFTNPTGAVQTFTLDRQIEIGVEQEGYYLFEINLTTSTQDSYALISEGFNLFVEEFKFGYFQKSKIDVVTQSENIVTFTFSSDFQLDENQPLQIDVDNKNIADATYYEENGKCFITVIAKSKGETTLKLSAAGQRIGETGSSNHEAELTIAVGEIEKNNSVVAIWVCFGIMMAGFVVYLIISFVKSRRFGVK